MYNKTTLLVATIVLLSGFQSLPADDAEYRLTFVGSWTLQPLPFNAHFTPLAGATHAEPGAVFAVGGLASQGVENVAETGSTAAFIAEINNGISDGDYGALVIRPGNIGPSGDVTVDFEITPENSLFSFLTMIAPSPDWFVGVQDFELRPNGVWLDEVTIELNSYDAGTENGTGFSLSNPPTNPQAMIAPLDNAEPTGPLVGIGSIATATFTRIDANQLTLGDVNNDGNVDLLDVNPFVELLSSQDFNEAADINCDGVIDLLDVQPFVNLLSSN